VAADALQVHQFVPVLLPHDAVGNHTLETRRALKEGGLDGRIWAVSVHPQLGRYGRPYGEFTGAVRRRGRRVLLYQAASVSGGIVDFLIKRSEPKIISYHNLTPARFYQSYEPATAAGLTEAAQELERLARCVRVGLAASEFNAADLRKMGVRDVRVVPPYLGPGLRAEPDPDTLARLGAGKKGIDLLFVGRIVPNKAHQRLVRMMVAMRAAIDPKARLHIVGPAGPEAYRRVLVGLVERLVPGGVIFTGAVSDADLAAHYRHADAFVCLSEHEGFGVPLVEAMRARVPIVAYDAGAVGETLAGTGVLLRTVDPRTVAEVVARVACDQHLRGELTSRQLRRAAELESFPRDEVILRAVEAAES
jgi:glycosyltransferase involved in cell wall biosynthesis